MTISAKDISTFVEKTDADRKLIQARAGELSAENDRLRKEAGTAVKQAKKNAEALEDLKAAKAANAALAARIGFLEASILDYERKVASYEKKIAEADAIQGAFERLTAASRP